MNPTSISLTLHPNFNSPCKIIYVDDIYYSSVSVRRSARRGSFTLRSTALLISTLFYNEFDIFFIHLNFYHYIFFELFFSFSYSCYHRMQSYFSSHIASPSWEHLLVKHLWVLVLSHGNLSIALHNILCCL